MNGGGVGTHVEWWRYAYALQLHECNAVQRARGGWQLGKPATVAIQMQGVNCRRPLAHCHVLVCPRDLATRTFGRSLPAFPVPTNPQRQR